MNQLTKQFRERITLFQALPDEIYSQIDLTGFFLPSGNIEQLRQELEDELGHFVVSYKAEVFNLEVRAREHLCALVKGARLNTKQLAILKKYEQLAEPFKVTFVIYQKPIEIMEIKTSALYKEYLKRGLL